EAAAIAQMDGQFRRDQGIACPSLVSAAVAHHRIDTASRRTSATGERADSQAALRNHLLNLSMQRHPQTRRHSPNVRKPRLSSIFPLLPDQEKRSLADRSQPRWHADT